MPETKVAAADPAHNVQLAGVVRPDTPAEQKLWARADEQRRIVEKLREELGVIRRVLGSYFDRHDERLKNCGGLFELKLLQGQQSGLEANQQRFLLIAGLHDIFNKELQRQTIALHRRDYDAAAKLFPRLEERFKAYAQLNSAPGLPTTIASWEKFMPQLERLMNSQLEGAAALDTISRGAKAADMLASTDILNGPDRVDALAATISVAGLLPFGRFFKLGKAAAATTKEAAEARAVAARFLQALEGKHTPALERAISRAGGEIEAAGAGHVFDRHGVTRGVDRRGVVVQMGVDDASDIAVRLSPEGRLGFFKSCRVTDADAARRAAREMANGISNPDRSVRLVVGDMEGVFRRELNPATREVEVVERWSRTSKSAATEGAAVMPDVPFREIAESQGGNPHWADSMSTSLQKELEAARSGAGSAPAKASTGPGIVEFVETPPGEYIPGNHGRQEVIANGSRSDSKSAAAPKPKRGPAPPTTQVEVILDLDNDRKLFLSVNQDEAGRVVSFNVGEKFRNGRWGRQRGGGAFDLDAIKRDFQLSDEQVKTISDRLTKAT